MSRLERDLVAKQIRYFRDLERIPGRTVIDRGFDDYQGSFGGLDFFFDRVRKLGVETILDLGAGNTKGAFELSQSSIGEGLSFQATGLVRHPEIDQYLGFDRFRTTSAELLTGFKNEILGGVLALHSVEFSASPEMVVDRIDDVLVPGGVFKMVMFHRSEDGTRAYPRFVFSLLERGYDLCLLEGDDVVSNDTDVLLAIKPGGKLDTTAVELMHADAKKYFEWEDYYSPQYKTFDGLK